MKSRISSILAPVILLTIVTFLAVDVGFSLYKPDRLETVSQSCILDIISGEIKAMEQDGLSWVKAEDGMQLEPGTRVRTMAGAHASIIFAQGTTSKLEPGTEVVIEKLENSSETQPYVIVLKQQAGRTWNQVVNTDGDCDFKIDTSSADIIVHGTLFSTEIGESGETIVKTMEGRVSVSAEGEEVLVTSGEMTTVQSGEAPSSPTLIPQARSELVFTMEQDTKALITDPTGSSTGYDADDKQVNQIPGSRIDTNEDSEQTVRIVEPYSGEYTVTLSGDTEDTNDITVEGFTEGKSSFIYSESSNVTKANNPLLKLHCDVLEGVLQSVAVLNPMSKQEAPKMVYVASTAPDMSKKSTTTPSDSADIDTETKNLVMDGVSEKKQELWFNKTGNNNIIQWLTSAGIIVFLGLIYVFVYRRN